jgi:flagellar motor switch protein FliM
MMRERERKPIRRREIEEEEKEKKGEKEEKREEITPSQILTQDEVDALLRSLRRGEIPVAVPEEVKPEEKEKYPRYDFRKVGRFVSKMRLPSLEVIHRRFATEARSILSAALQKIIDIGMIDVTVGEFSSFLDNIPLPASFVVVSMKPLRGFSLWAFEGPLVLSIIDILLGGTGKGTKAEGREFTRIEQRLLKRVISTMLKPYQEAWDPVMHIEPEIVRLESHPQFVTIIPESDLIVSTRYEIDLGMVSGKLYIGIPYAILEPIRSQLQAGYQPSSLEIDRRWLERLISKLKECPVEIKCEIGRAKITLRELLSFKKGDIIKLNSSPNEESAVAFVQGVPKYIGIPGTFGESKAMLVTKVLRSEQELLQKVLSKIVF